MKRYAVLGFPLKFCLTTPVFNGLFRALDMEAECETREVTPEGLSQVMTELREGKLSGLVLTRPHKTPALFYLDEVSEEATLLNAVNEVVRLSNGKVKGDNTDWMGVIRACQRMMPELGGKHILVLGAGGAARAAAYGFQKEKARISIWNRTPERAKAFAEQIGAEWVENLSRWEGHPDIIINATDAANSDRQSTLVPYPIWQKVQIALDAVYGKTSLFLEEAKASHIPHVLAGEIWFMEQSERVFEFLTGVTPSRDLLEDLIRESQVIQKT